VPRHDGGRSGSRVLPYPLPSHAEQTRADRADCDADAYIEAEYEKIVCEISEHSGSLVGMKKNYFDGKKDST
jgi:hypothetical protein